MFWVVSTADLKTKWEYGGDVVRTSVIPSGPKKVKKIESRERKQKSSQLKNARS